MAANSNGDEERNRLVQQYMLLQQQRTSAFAGLPRTPQQQQQQQQHEASSAPPLAPPTQGTDPDDLEALQREFDSQFSHVLTTAAAGDSSPSPPPPLPPQQRAVPSAAPASPLPASGGDVAGAVGFTAIGGVLQPNVSHIPPPPAVPAKKAPAVAGLPPSTKRWSHGRSDPGELANENPNELIQRLTSELLNTSVPVPPTTRRMPPSPQASTHGGDAGEGNATVSINVDQLRMMLEALKQ
jgi:hypothetical protein